MIYPNRNSPDVKTLKSYEHLWQLPTEDKIAFHVKQRPEYLIENTSLNLPSIPNILTTITNIITELKKNGKNDSDNMAANRIY